MYTNTSMFCVVYSSIQKFTIITIMKTAIFITIIFVISILSNYLNYRTALPQAVLLIRPVHMTKIASIECKIHINCVHMEFDLGQFKLTVNDCKSISQLEDKMQMLHNFLCKQGCKEHHSRSRHQQIWMAGSWDAENKRANCPLGLGEHSELRAS